MRGQAEARIWLTDIDSVIKCYWEIKLSGKICEEIVVLVFKW